MPFYVPPSKASCCLSPTQLGGTDVFYTGPNIPAFGIITNDTLNDVIQKLAVVVSDVYTDEQAQDAIGSILLNTPSVTFTYNDGTPPSIAANIVDAYILSLIGSNPNNNYIQNQALVSQIATSRITGNQAAGSFTALISSITLANRNTDPTITNGALVYRSDLNKFRGVVNNVWQNIATEDQIPPAILNQNFSAQLASMWISGTARIGAGTDNGAKLQINGGVLSTAVSATDYPIINGGTFYRSDTNKQRIGINGVWKNLVVEGQAVVAGLTMYVDNNAPGATDVRTGLSPTSMDSPFLTIQAAVLNRPSGAYVVYVRKGTYTEVVSWTAILLALTIILEPDVIINGNVYNWGDLTIIGMSRVTVDSSLTNGTAQIYTNVAEGAMSVRGTPLGGVHGDEGWLRLVNVISRNTGTGIGVGGFSFSIEGCRLISIGMTAKCTYFYGTQLIRDSWCFSRDSMIAESMSGAMQYYRSTFISTSGTYSVFDGYNGAQVIEGCKIYSQNFGAIGRFSVPSTRLNAGPVLYRDNYFNTYLELALIGDSANEVDVPFEISGNVFNVRHPGVVHAFQLTMGLPKTYAPVVMNNTYNKASFNVVIAGQTTITSNNLGNVAFAAPNPWIYDATAPLLAIENPVRAFLAVTTALLIFLSDMGIVLTEPQATVLDDMMIAGAPTEDIEAYLLSLGYVVDLP